MNEPSNEVRKSCLKCGYVRLPSDGEPKYACPKCGAVYEKVQDALRALEKQRLPSTGRGNDSRVEVVRNAREAAGLRLSRKADSRDTLIAHLVYVLYALPIGTALVGVIIAHLMSRSDAAPWLQAHFRWQIRTFWFAIGWLLLLLVFAATASRISYAYFQGTGKIGGPLFWQGLGGAGKLLYLSLLIWLIYRLVRGWVQLFRGRDVKG